MSKKINVKSVFKYSAIFDMLWILLGIIGLLSFLVFALVKNTKGITLSFVAFQLFFLLLLVLSAYVLTGFKHVTLHVNDQKLTYYSLLRPQGRSFYLKEFIGYIHSLEATPYGNINVVHLVNKKSYTQFKIHIEHYKNAELLIEALCLKKIENYKFDRKKYFKLIFTERIRVIKNDL